MDDYKKGGTTQSYSRKRHKAEKASARWALKEDLRNQEEAADLDRKIEEFERKHDEPCTELEGFDTKPCALRQGCISAIFRDDDGELREGTEEEWDRLHEATFGDSDAPPTETRPKKTPKEAPAQEEEADQQEISPG